MTLKVNVTWRCNDKKGKRQLPHPGGCVGISKDHDQSIWMIAPEVLLLQHKNLRNLLFSDSNIDFFLMDQVYCWQKKQIDTALHSKTHTSSLVTTSALQFSSVFSCHHFIYITKKNIVKINRTNNFYCRLTFIVITYISHLCETMKTK